MILYFSATGNSRHVAERIAMATGDSILSIVDCIRQNRYQFEDEAIGMVAPTYYHGLPSVVFDFLKKAEIKSGYYFFVSTYGTRPSATANISGRKPNAFFSVRMPDTWTPQFDLSTPEKVAFFTTTTEEDIANTIAMVKSQAIGNHQRHKTSAIFGRVAYMMYDAGRATRHLSASDDCIGCGLCAKQCPVQAIEMKDKHPVWVKPKCTMCLGCLHHCPKFAIQYGDGKATRKHGQYTFKQTNRDK